MTSILKTSGQFSVLSLPGFSQHSWHNRSLLSPWNIFPFGIYIFLQRYWLYLLGLHCIFRNSLTSKYWSVSEQLFLNLNSLSRGISSGLSSLIPSRSWQHIFISPPWISPLSSRLPCQFLSDIFMLIMQTQFKHSTSKLNSVLPQLVSPSVLSILLVAQTRRLRAIYGFSLPYNPYIQPMSKACWFYFRGYPEYDSFSIPLV